MPPQVRGSGPGPITTNTSEGAQEVKSAEVQKKSPEPQKEASKNEATVPRQATPKEVSNKKGEMAAQAAAQKSMLDNKLHVIQGTSGDDSIHVSKGPGLVGVLGMYEVNVNGASQYVTKTQLEHSEIRAGRGNDRIVVDSDVSANMKIDGGAGNDVIIGGRGQDEINGGSGRDVIFGRDGNDRISGGKGNDVLFGGKGHDVINGGEGNDRIDGGAGFDSINHGNKKK